MDPIHPIVPRERRPAPVPRVTAVRRSGDDEPEDRREPRDRDEPAPAPAPQRPGALDVLA